MNASSGVVSSGAGLEQLLGLYNQGRLEEALKLGISLSQQHPNDANIPNILGAAESGRGNHDQAIVHYNKAIKLKPDRADFYNNLAIAYKRVSQFELATQAYLRSIEINPLSSEVYNNLAAMIMEYEGLENSEGYYKRSNALKPQSEEAYFNFANGNVASGNFHIADKLYDTVLIINPSHGKRLRKECTGWIRAIRRKSFNQEKTTGMFGFI